MNARRILIPIALWILFAVPAQADPIEYTITWTWSYGSLAPSTYVTTYTYDADTALFFGLGPIWDMDFDVSWAWNDMDRESREQRQQFLIGPSEKGWGVDCLLSRTGFYECWAVADGIFGRYYGMNGIDISNGGFFTVTGPTVDPPDPPIPAVPEPATLTLCATGIAGLLFTRRRRRGRAEEHGPVIDPSPTSSNPRKTER